MIDDAFLDQFAPPAQRQTPAPPEPVLVEGRAFVTFTGDKEGPSAILQPAPRGRDAAIVFQDTLKRDGFCLLNKDEQGNIIHKHFGPATIVDVTVYRVNNPHTS